MTWYIYQDVSVWSDMNYISYGSPRFARDDGGRACDYGGRACDDGGRACYYGGGVCDCTSLVITDFISFLVI